MLEKVKIERLDGFEAIVGKSLQDEKFSKRFGFVCTYDDKSKFRLNTMLQKQGLQMNQDDTFFLMVAILGETTVN